MKHARCCGYTKQLLFLFYKTLIIFTNHAFIAIQNRIDDLWQVKKPTQFLIIKMLQKQRHTGMDYRYPDYMDVMFTSLP